MQNPSQWTLALRSLRFFRKTHAALALGIAAATAVIVGALVVGDSVRGSLRKVVTDRLANIECLLHARVYFSPEILEDLAENETNTHVTPGIIFDRTTVEFRDDGNVSRTAGVQLLAMDDSFWSHIELPVDAPSIGEDEVALNASLANDLGVSLGDEISVRVEQLGGVPGDNPLGDRDDRSVNVPRQKVVAILPDQSVGGVSFLSSQSVSRNIFASLTTIQDILEADELVNAALVLSDMPGPSGGSPSTDGENQQARRWCDEFNLHLRPALEDYGLTLEHHRRVFPDAEVDRGGEAAQDNEQESPDVVFDYYQLSSKELILDEGTSDAVVDQLGDTAHRHLTYLGNSIAKVDPRPGDLALNRLARAYETANLDDDSVANSGRPSLAALGILQPTGVMERERINVDRPLAPALSREVPYSIMVGVNHRQELDLLQYIEVPTGELYRNYCWINSWLAEQLDAKAGDWIRVKYFEPETIDGKEIEVATRFHIAGIVPVTEPRRGYVRSRPASFDSRPTIFNDPGLTPTVPGVTDQDSISKWDLPFTLDNDLITRIDDVYWNNHRLTPKVFLPYRYASEPQLFASRFGDTTAIRFETADIESVDRLRQKIEEALLSTRSNKGLSFLPVKARQLQAASGTTPFDMLFLSLSFFVIVAALVLVYLLFRLGIQQRASELGVMMAQGFRPGRIRNLLLREFGLVGIVGSLLGILLGILYARLMIAGLETWWIGAISTQFLTFFATPTSLVIGAVSGFVASLIAIFLGLRRLNRVNVLDALRNRNLDESEQAGKLSRVSLAVAGFVAFAAVGLVIAGVGQQGMARAGSFFGSGMLLLLASLLATRQLIEFGSSNGSDVRRGSLMQLAAKAVCRNPLRSTLSLGLLSVATFLIASMSVFQVSPTERGYGGFNLLAESSQPIYRNIASATVRQDYLGEDAKELNDTTIVPMRAKRGEDASCNNLFQVAQPTILGVPNRLRELHDFAPDSVEFDWAATHAPENPWAALRSAATGEQHSPIPVILDQNTAAWSLKQGASLDSIIRIEHDNRVTFFRTVGLLSNSVLQGKLLIDEQNLENLYPELGGYSFFMIRTGKSQDVQTVSNLLEKGWSEEGLDVTSSQELLEKFLGVQNTYISAFQSLGALGLLLGTFGLVAVQLRSVLERQREFALMQAVGFAPRRISKMLTMETAFLLCGGLLVGVICAAVAVVPYIIEVGPQLSLFNPILMLGFVFLAGMLAALIAVRAAMRQSVLDGLRSQ